MATLCGAGGERGDITQPLGKVRRVPGPAHAERAGRAGHARALRDRFSIAQIGIAAIIGDMAHLLTAKAMPVFRRITPGAAIDLMALEGLAIKVGGVFYIPGATVMNIGLLQNRLITPQRIGVGGVIGGGLGGVGLAFTDSKAYTSIHAHIHAHHLRLLCLHYILNPIF